MILIIFLLSRGKHKLTSSVEAKMERFATRYFTNTFVVCHNKYKERKLIGHYILIGDRMKNRLRVNKTISLHILR